MQLECWNIQGTSFHFGTHGLGQEQTMVTMPSDSLFAALVARLARTHGSQVVEEFCKPFVDKKPPFVISSTFPFAGQVRFFPVPMLSRRDDSAGISGKELKRIQFVSEDVFRSLLNGTPLARLYNAAYTLQSRKILLSKQDFEKLPDEIKHVDAQVWRIEQRPRVALDRSSSKSNLFHIGQVNFSKQCGLWFGVHWLEADKKLQSQFANMLHELAEAGLGAERTVGLGIAKVSGPVPMELPDADGEWVTLSRYLPNEDETSALAHDNSAYSIKTVGGWLDSPTNMGQRRIPVHLIEEGSVIGAKPARSVPGQVVDVRPSYGTDKDPLKHPVYRCGLALAVGMKGVAE